MVKEIPMQYIKSQKLGHLDIAGMKIVIYITKALTVGHKVEFKKLIRSFQNPHWELENKATQRDRSQKTKFLQSHSIE